MPFACPRCHDEVDDEFYGPCPSCRTQLRAVMAGEAREVEDTRFEPAMHVTPNAVALKE
jgi:Zn finger protein HypA/HybF involved in hydrogenase expression